MRKCHFSILYNELPFLKQKMDFLYDNFDQLIFYDLNVGTSNPHFSTDGSHEFIKDYPDPDNKITLIEKKDLSDVSNFRGDGSIEKRKMFAVGSSYVWDDIDSFWCFDLDEFFHKSLLQKVDDVFEKNLEVNSIEIDHYVFLKDHETIIVDEQSDRWKFYSRIARHKPGNVYGHCTISSEYLNTYKVEDESCYHFAWVGETRVKNKINHYTKPPTGSPNNIPLYEKWTINVWNKFKDFKSEIKSDEIFGYPNMHPSVPKGLKKYCGIYPEYINLNKMIVELNQMNEAVVLSHLGMGDMIGISPAVRHYCKKYDEVYIFTKEKNSKNVFSLYDDVPNLNIITIDNDSTSELKQINFYLNQIESDFDLISSGLYKEDRSEFVNLPDNFYNDFDLDYSVYEEEFNLPNKVFEDNTLLDLLDSVEYNFVVGTSSTKDITEEILDTIEDDLFIVNPSKNVYREEDPRYQLAEKFLNLPLFDYTNIIKNAKGVYLIDSSFSLLSKFVASKDTKKVLYNRSGYDLSSNFFSDWEILK